MTKNANRRRQHQLAVTIDKKLLALVMETLMDLYPKGPGFISDKEHDRIIATFGRICAIFAATFTRSDDISILQDTLSWVQENMESDALAMRHNLRNEEN